MSFSIQDTLLTNAFTPLSGAVIKAVPNGQPVYTSEDGGTFHPLLDPTRSVTTAVDGTFTLPLPKPSQTYPTSTKWTISLPPSSAFPLGAAIYGTVPELDASVTLYTLLTTYGWTFVQNTTTIPITVQGPAGVVSIGGAISGSTPSSFLYVDSSGNAANIPFVKALTDAATIATDASQGTCFTVTLGGNRTLANPTNLKAGLTYTWVVRQDGTGSRTLAYGNLFKWPGGTAPTLTTTAGAVDVISAVYDGTQLNAVWQGDFR